YLAVVEAANGRVDDALARLDRIESTRRATDEVSPTEHYTLLNTHARVLDAAGRPEDSLPLHVAAAEAAADALGPHHPATADMRENVATTHWTLGHRRTALDVLREALEDTREPRPPTDARRRCTQAARLREVGRMQDAEHVLQPLLASDDALAAVGTPCLVIAGVGLAVAGRLPQAERVRQVVLAREPALGPQLRYWLDLVAALQLEPRDLQAAAASLSQLTEVGRWLFAEQPTLTYWAASLWARNRWRAEDCPAAEPVAQSVLPAEPGPLDLSQIRCAHVLARCRAAAGDPEGAARWEAVTTSGLAGLEVAWAPAQDPLGPWLEPAG
ncbi:MAG: tetratricopeptide repeat protein, partial [Myxococcales bacterium]|nr:tetratricopeptide repeat protein [Myxococcales bacterium]